MTKLLTNFLICHSKESSQFATEDSCSVCQMVVVNLGSSTLPEPFSSSKLSEARGFFVPSVERISTPFCSFNSTRLVQKTLGRLTFHSGCSLVKSLMSDDVVSPYLIKRRFDHLLHPEDHAPPYAQVVPPIYESLLSLCPELMQSSEREEGKYLLMPFCNSFICSVEVFNKYKQFIGNVIQRSWKVNRFEFEWCNSWSHWFPGREFGLLVERATALWFASNPDLRVLGTGYGTGYPHANESLDIGSWGWLSTDAEINNQETTPDQYN